MQIVTTSNTTALKKEFILGGQLTVKETPHRLVTILGSCVSVCLWDRKTKTGGMNHFLLPETVNDQTSLHGGIASTRKLIQTMHKFSTVKNMEAKIYGGANRFFTQDSFLSVGLENVRAAKFALDEAGISIAFQDTGGQSGRKIYFNTQTGMVQVIKVN